jgi:hypothetical protein
VRLAARQFAAEVHMTRTKTLAVATGLFLVCGAVAFGPMVVAQSDDRSGESPWFKCSNRTLRGDYGFSIDGTILAGTPNAFLLRGVAMTHFDGQGNLSQVDFTTRNGAPVSANWRTAVGTYDIDEDCTGSAQIIQADGSPTLNLRLVVVDRGREVRTIVVGNATGSVGIRVD